MGKQFTGKVLPETMFGGLLMEPQGHVQGTRPRRDQKLVYNGHKRYHCLKYQSVATLNGIIANLFDPLEVRCHDSFIQAHSGVLVQLEQHSFHSQGNNLCINSDAGDTLCADIYIHLFLETLHKQQQKYFNEAMSKVRVSVAWLFGDIIKQFKFTYLEKNQKIGLSPIAKQYGVIVLLTNTFTCLYRNNNSQVF